MAEQREPAGPGAGQEPDYRFTLANERTFLAWIRTGLALLAAGVAVVQLVPDLTPVPLRLALGLALIVLALVLVSTSYRRWKRVDTAIRQGRPLPRAWMPSTMAAALSLIIVLTIVLIVLDNPRL
jgi:putative membrane protein